MDAPAVKPRETAVDALRAAAGHPSAAYVIVVHKGPTWDVGDIEPYCHLLSKRFTGEVWAFGSYDGDTVIGRMRVRVVSEQPFRHFANRVRFVRRALAWIEQLRTARVANLAVIALDPFTTGLLGLYAARRAGGVLVCEVNGVYANRHNTANTRIAFIRFLRVFVRRLVGAFVLHRATAVRLLFADQLRGFARLPPQIITRQFFETTNLAAFHSGAEEPIILGVGHPFRVKGFDTLCRAFARIADQYPSWRVVLIGYKAPEEVRAGGLEHPRIEVHPGLKQPQVADWMSRCAIFALPSRTEAMGRVLLEAAAAGKCRLAARVDGIPTVIEDGVDGLLVEPESVEQLAAKLEQLMGDPGLRVRLGDAARRRAEREFSDESYLDHYSELVSAALRQGPA